MVYINYYYYVYRRVQRIRHNKDRTEGVFLLASGNSEARKSTRTRASFLLGVGQPHRANVSQPKGYLLGEDGWPAQAMWQEAGGGT